MGLFTSYSSANCRVLERLKTTLEREVEVKSIRIDGHTYNVEVYKYTRRRTKRFQYFGMDATTADTCMADMARLFSRRYNDQSLSAIHTGGVVSGFEFVRRINGDFSIEDPEAQDRYYKMPILVAADFDPVTEDDGSYSVEVRVDESLNYYSNLWSDDNQTNLPDKTLELNPEAMSNRFKGWFVSDLTRDDEDFDYGVDA